MAMGECGLSSEQLSDDESEAERKVSEEACNVLNELRQTGQLCDAAIKVDGGAFRVHRAIISACSPYFRALFTNGMTESSMREIYISGVSPKMMGFIIDYAYSKEFTVSSENVEELLPVADQLCVTGLKRLCCRYLKQNLSPDNCIGIKKFGRCYFCHQLERVADRYLQQNFTEIFETSEEFLGLEVDELVPILSSDGLNVKDELVVFSAILKWIGHDVESRRRHMGKLLQCIRLALLLKDEFFQVKAHPFVRDNEECRPLVTKTLKFLFEQELNGVVSDVSDPLARPREPYELLFAFGGWSRGSPTNVLEVYDTRADRWIPCESVDNVNRAYHGMVSIGHQIYIIGGFDGRHYFNTVRCFSPLCKAWTERAPMHSRRCYVSVTVLDGFIYAMGGFDGNLRQNTAERYEPRTNQWTMIQPMTTQRSDAGATTLDGKVYIAGGFDGVQCLSTAECYSPTSGQWTLLCPMHGPRSGVSLTAYRGCLYCLGGFDGADRLSTGEMWDPKVVDDSIFAIGGFDGTQTISQVECYDGGANEWYDVLDMNVVRSAVSACVVRGLPNAKDFISLHSDPKSTSEENAGDASHVEEAVTQMETE